MAVILRYFSEFGSFGGALRKSSRLLSHLVMSSCYFICLTKLSMSAVEFCNVYSVLTLLNVYAYLYVIVILSSRISMIGCKINKIWLI